MSYPPLPFLRYLFLPNKTRITDVADPILGNYFCINTERKSFIPRLLSIKTHFFNPSKLLTMNLNLSIILALLIALGVTLTQNEWNNLTSEQKTQYQKK